MIQNNLTNKKLFLKLVVVGIILLISSCHEKTNTKCPSERVKNAVDINYKMQWWNEARFGMFIHWGVYTVPAGIYKGKKIPGVGEWIMHSAKIPVAEYKKFASQFNPLKYDPEAWVKIAKNAGMKYIVITSKHHDGFALFDSKVTDWDVVDATPYRKDLLKPLAEACKKEGIKLGFYYSEAQDWCHPGGAVGGWNWDNQAQDGDMGKYIDRIAVPQLKEILSNYGNIDILWFDSPHNMVEAHNAKILSVVKQYPNLIINGRLGCYFDGDFETPEQFIPVGGFSGRAWETCMTMNDTWGYKSEDNNWKSPKEIIQNLSSIVSKGGNFLLNVGPTSLGEIPHESVEMLQQVGEWMKINGEAVYGTSASPFSYLPWGNATQKGQKLYLHVIRWPGNGRLKVPLKNHIKKAYTLINPGKELEYSHDNDWLVLSVPEQAPDPAVSIIAIEFEDVPNVILPPSIRAKATASSVDAEAGKYPVMQVLIRSSEISSIDAPSAVENLFDGDHTNIWKPVFFENKAWVQVDLGMETSIANISISEPTIPLLRHGQKFQLQYKKENQWITILEGITKIGYSQDFEPVKARYFRLWIQGEDGRVPALCELTLNHAF